MFDSRGANEADLAIVCIVGGSFHWFLGRRRHREFGLRVFIAGLFGLAGLAAIVSATPATASCTRLGTLLTIGVVLGVLTAGGSCPSAATATSTTLAGRFRGLVVGHCGNERMEETGVAEKAGTSGQVMNAAELWKVWGVVGGETEKKARVYVAD